MLNYRVLVKACLWEPSPIGNAIIECYYYSNTMWQLSTVNAKPRSSGSTVEIPR